MSIKLTSALMIFALTAPLFAADYSDCANFFNPWNPSPTETPKSNDGFFPGGGMNGVFPFNMGKDGKLAVATWSKNYTKDDKTGNEIIEYDMPVMKYEGDYKMGEQPKYEVDKKRVKVIVNRDSDGNITSIYHDYGISKKEIEEHNEIMKKWKNKVYNPKYLKEMEMMNKKWGIKDEDFAFIPAGNTYKFSMVGGKDGKCRLDSSEMNILVEAKVDGKKMTTTTFDTEVCYEIGKALKKYKKQLDACTNPEANGAISKIGAKYFSANKEKGLGGMGLGGMPMGGFGYGSPMPGMAMGFGAGVGLGGGMFPSFESFLLPLTSQIPGATPPLVSAMHLNQYCAMMGITPFMNDDFWVNTKNLIAAPGSKDSKKK